MIVQEQFEINGRQFVRTYSDAGRYIVGGDPYGEYFEACDPAELGRTYAEGDPMPSEEIEPHAEEVLNILMGVSE